jgi:hypothetical protein
MLSDTIKAALLYIMQTAQSWLLQPFFLTLFFVIYPSLLIYHYSSIITRQ